MIFSKRFFREAALIISLSIALGLAVNFPLVKRFLHGELDPRFVSDKDRAGIVLITLPEAEDLFADGRGLFVDARPRKDFEAGHISGAQSLPLEEAAEKINAFAAAVSPDQYPVVYCGDSDCLTSLSLAKLLSAQGLKEIRVFLGGWTEWKNAGLPEGKGHDQE